MELLYNVKNQTTLKEILKNELHISSRLVKKIKFNRIYINDKVCRINDSVSVNDIIKIDLDFKEDNSNIVANKNIPIEILYEDEWLIILNKQSGIPVHPTLNYYENSLSNGLKYYYDINNIQKLIRPVNRIDKDTTGIVVFAKSEYIQDCLSYEMENNIFKKKYLAIVEGKIDKDGIINKPIARKAPSIIEREINENGASAITEYKVLKAYENYTLVECSLLTGRTHQIRVHFASIGHPLLGDTLYGNKSDLINRQALHSYKVSFVHPITKKIIQIKSEIPKDCNKIL